MTRHSTDIIKSAPRRTTEPFDKQKLHRSLMLALLSERSHEGEAEVTAEKICSAVAVWLQHRPEVTSADLRRVASKHLQRYNPGAAYIYEHYRHTI